MDDTVEQDDVVGRLRAGDPLSWETLYRRMYPSMLAYARRRLSSAEEAQDAVSEALTRTVAGLDRLADAGARPESWLFGVLRHVVMDRQRTTTDVVTSPADARSTHPTRWSRWWSTRSSAPSDPLSTKLSERDRELLELRVVAGFSADEVAELLDMQPGAVRTAQSRALDRLRSLLVPAEEVGT